MFIGKLPNNWIHIGAIRAMLPAARIEALLEACRLPFDPACLRFHETRREVRSPSVTPVRQTLRRHTAHILRYGDLLNPLCRALEQATSGSLE